MDLRYPGWQKPYHEALLELDPEKLVQRVAYAEAAIALRLQALNTSSSGHVERQAIQEALVLLLDVKKETLKLPDFQRRELRHIQIAPELW